MNWTKRLLLALGLLVLTCVGASAQGVLICYQIPGLNCQAVSSGNPLPVSASVSASISGFTATSTGTPISVTSSGVTGTLPAGTVVVVTNVGATNGAYCALGASATTSSQYLSPGGGWFAFTVGASTQLTCITSTSTTTVNMTGGTGLPTGTGGGGGGGSSSNASVSSTGAAVPSSATYLGIISGGNLTGWTGAVTNTGTFATQSAITAADGADVTQGSTTDAAASPGGVGTVSAKLRETTSLLNSINTNITAAVPALNATAYNTNGPYTNGQTNPVNADLNGNLYTNTGINRWAGTTLGAPSNYGTSPGAVEAPGVNAFATNLAAGTAGSPSGGVQSVQGVSGGTSMPVSQLPSSSSTFGIAPTVAGSAASNVVLKSGAGNLYNSYATCTATCWLMIFNATTAPSDGATTAGNGSGNLQDCVPIPSGGVGGVNYNPGPPEVFSVGITAVISSTACGTKTAASTGFIHGSVQ